MTARRRILAAVILEWSRTLPEHRLTFADWLWTYKRQLAA